MRIDDVLPRLLAADPAAPRVTFYDDTPGPTQGERIELSAKVLTNWVHKAANLLVAEFDVAPGDTVRLMLPAEHWRTVYWAFAVWAVGGCVVADGPADVVVSDDPAQESDILVTLAALARTASEPTAGIDEAKELAGYPDDFVAVDRADDDSPALDDLTVTGVVAQRPTPGRHWVQGDLPQVLTQVARVFAAEGSVLLVRGADPNRMADRLRQESVDPSDS